MQKAYLYLLIILLMLTKWLAFTPRGLAINTPLLYITTEATMRERTLQYTYYDFTFKVMMVSPDGRDRQVRFSYTVENCLDCALYDVAWMPSSKRLALVAMLNSKVSASMSAEVYVIDIEQGTFTQVDTDVSVLTQLTFSPDGSKLAYVRPTPNTTAENSRSTLVIVNWQTGQILNQIEDMSALSAVLGAPQWDPQAMLLLFQKTAVNTENNRTGLNAQLDQVRLTDGAQTTLASNAFRPRWSPDGASIAYCESTEQTIKTGEGYISLMDRDGQNPRRLTQARQPCRDLVWLPQGDRLLYSDGRNLFTVTVVGGVIQKVFGSGTPVNQVRISPDGQHLAFIRNNWLEVLPLDGSGKVRRLTDTDEYVVGIAW